MQWTKEMELGHDRIDAEHRIFLRLVNEFSDRIDGGASLDALLRTLREIRQYAAFHFASEENVMEEMGYPDLQAHRGCHEALLAAVDEKIRLLPAHAAAPKELLGFLADWFAQHTSQEDHKLVAHINAVGWSNINIINPFY